VKVQQVLPYSAGDTGPTGPTGSAGDTGPTGPAGQLDKTVQVVGMIDGNFTVDWTLGSNATIDLTEAIGNFRLYVTNLPTTPMQLYDLIIILSQGATPYYIDAMNVNGNVVTGFGFLNNTPPYSLSAVIEIQKFKIFYVDSSTVFIFSELQSYYAPPPPA
jgi:hypothetical protein